MKASYVRISVSCCSSDLEELVATVVETFEGSLFRCGDRVFAVVDYRSCRLRFSKDRGPLSSMMLPETHVFRIPDALDDVECPQLIPLIKCGTICFYALQTHKISEHTIVALDCDCNVSHLMSRILRRITKHIHPADYANAHVRIRWHEDALEIESKGKLERIDFSVSNVIDVFGLDNVRKVIEYVAENDIRADVIHRPTFSRSPSSRSRFFDVIDVA